MNKYLIVLAGPTAVGKTKTSIQIADQLGVEIFSADSRQFYREMEIGTAKPSFEELQQAKHHFINSRSIFEDYSVGDYERDGIQQLDNYFNENSIGILTGGTGLYIKAICEGLDDFPETDPSIRKALNLLKEEKGIEVLQAELREKDPVYFAEADTQNPHRLIRALEIIRTTGKTFSSFRHKNIKQRNFKPIYIALNLDRSVLYERINQRVDLMIKKGLVDEARKLFPEREINALQTVGYRELFSYFENDIGLEEAIELIKRNTRRYAKRQVTWFKNSGDYTFFEPKNITGILSFIKAKTRKET